MKLCSTLSAGLLGICLLNVSAATVTVDAGDFERRDVVVQFKLGTRNISSAEPIWEKQTLIDGTDRFGRKPAELPKALPIPVQQDEEGNASFTIHQLKRGEKQSFNLTPFRGRLATSVTVNEVKGRTIGLSVFGKNVFTYQMEKTEFPINRPDLKPIFHRAAYIHPVLTPSGAQVTDDYPMNHKHHHAIWMSWTGTEFEGRKPDFWNMGDGKGTVEFVALDKFWSGMVHAGFVARHRYMDLTAPEPKAALNETWTVHLFSAGAKSTQPYYLFDIEVKDECATKEPLKLPEYRYGGMCVRGNWAWNGKGKSFILTSEGETDAAKGDKGQVHARWVHLGGAVDGKFAGIAALAHPTNFRFPEPVRLNPAEPYFNFAPQQAGDMEITPEKPFTARYRFVVADGKPDRAELDRLWNDYAHPPVVTVSE